MKWRVLTPCDVSPYPQVFDPLRDVAEVITVEATREAVEASIGDCEAYYASLYVPFDAALLERAPRLRVIATPSTGTDHLDLKAAAARDIHVITLKHEIAFLESVTATAEMAWALLLAVVRHVPWSFAAAQRGHWARDEFRGRQLSGQTLGILGYGRLGKIMAQYGQAFRMRVLACDTAAIEPAPGVTLVDLPTLLRESDVFSIHIHLTEENRGLIGAPELAQMKPGAILLNTSRGAIIDEAALVEALTQGPMGGAGLDVIEGEWRSDLAEHPLIRHANTHQNLVISPHTGGITYESQAMAYEFVANKLAEYLAQQGAPTAA